MENIKNELKKLFNKLDIKYEDFKYKEGFMLFSKDTYYKGKCKQFSKIAQKHFKEFSQQHRFYIYQKLPNDREKNIVFILYNPSYATPEVKDPTINNCIYLAKKDGRFSSIEIINLYSERNPNIKKLTGASNKQNISFITELLKQRKNSVVVLAWGNKYIPSEWKDIMNYLKENKNLEIIISTQKGTKEQIRHPGNQGWSCLNGFKKSAKLKSINKINVTLDNLLKYKK